MATPGPVRFCPSCGSEQINVAYGKRIGEVGTFVYLDTYCYDCEWSGYIEPDIPEWEWDRWRYTRFIKR